VLSLLLPPIPYLSGFYTIIVILTLGALISVILDKEKFRPAITAISEVVLFIALIYIWDMPTHVSIDVIFDEFSRFLSFIFVFSSLLIILGLHRELEDVVRYGLAVALILTANIGMIIAASSLNIVYIVVGWELAGISTYAVIASRRTDPVAIEAAMKFFIVGSIGFGLSLFGISLIYGSTGSLYLPEIADKIQLHMYDFNLLFTGILILIAGMGFKMAIVPFHVWIPDTYEGAANSITSFLAAASKTMAFAVGLRIFYRGLFPVSNIWSPLFAVLAVITMTYANIAAIVQSKMKRLLAWSSIAHAGYVLLLFGAYGSSVNLLAGGLLHIFMHAIMKIMAFMAAIYITWIIGSDLIADYAGLGKQQKLVSLLLTIDLLAMAGIPPLGGFVSKWILFLGVIESGYVWLALAGAINSAISLYYYARIIAYMYFYEGKKYDVEKKPTLFLIPMIISTVVIIGVGITPEPLLAYLRTISP